MTNGRRSLNDLVINSQYQRPSDARSFTRAETFVLGWLVNCPDGRTYSNMMEECRLSQEQCQRAIEGLLELGVLRWR